MTERYKNPALTVDTIIFSIRDKTLKLLLIKRKNPPFQDKWAIPGGFVDYEEDIPDAAYRELEEETGIQGISLEQVRTFGTPGRDPRGRTVSVVYFSLINSAGLEIRADTDAKEAGWFSVYDLPETAFDHAEIIDFTVRFLRQKLENTPVARHAMPEKFSLEELREVYEIILNKTLNHEIFKQKITETNLLEKAGDSVYKFRESMDFIGRFS
ncbi:MAG: NUDIX domain-containing protein [Candidatus Lokiarchaeota archaeon]|nr:NUDIX domain-containing protein [Candidatus Lokiarchaeota archaeon]